MSDELRGLALESFDAAGGEEMGVGIFGEATFHLGVAAEVVLESVGDGFALWHEDDLRMVELLQDGLDEAGDERVVGAAEDDGVDERILVEELFQVGIDGIVHLLGVLHACFDHRYPAWTCLAVDDEWLEVETDGGRDLLYLHIV